MAGTPDEQVSGRDTADAGKKAALGVAREQRQPGGQLVLVDRQGRGRIGEDATLLAGEQHLIVRRAIEKRAQAAGIRRHRQATRFRISDRTGEIANDMAAKRVSPCEIRVEYQIRGGTSAYRADVQGATQLVAIV